MKTVNRSEFCDFIRRRRDFPNLEENAVEGTNISVMQYISGNKVIAQAVYQRAAAPRYQVQEKS